MRLGIEIEDIVDELHMLNQLFRTQISVLKGGSSLPREFSGLQALGQTMENVQHQLETKYMPQTKLMLSDAQRLRQSLYNLLDLQHKEDDTNEAHEANGLRMKANQQALFVAKQALSAQDSADAAEAQSLIRFIFTVVTIVFLPLSFFTSYFGMFDVKDSPNEGDTPTCSPSYVDKAICRFSGPFYKLALAVAGVLYYFRTKSLARDRIRGLLVLEYKGFLLEELIDEDHKEFWGMQEMRSEVEREQKAKFEAKEAASLEAKEKADKESGEARPLAAATQEPTAIPERETQYQVERWQPDTAQELSSIAITHMRSEEVQGHRKLQQATQQQQMGDLRYSDRGSSSGDHGAIMKRLLENNE